MHDEFLHRLRKDPSPEFAARLQGRLRRQATLSRLSRAPSLLGNLLTMLLLGGTAFAVTWIVMRGVPTPIAELYHHAAGMIASRHTSSKDHPGGNGEIRQGWWWGTNGASAPASSAARSGPAHPGGAAVGAPATSASSAAASSSVADGGALLGRGGELQALSSWSAYPYATAFVDLVNSDYSVNGGLPVHVHLSMLGSGHLLTSLCGAGPNDPSLAYTLAHVGSVSSRPCPPQASGLPSPVVAIPIDYEAVVLARSPLYGAPDLTRRDVFLALAQWVPDPSRPGTIYQNPNTTWRQVDASLGPEPIEILGPPLSSAAGRAMVALLMQGGCDTYSWVAALKSTDPDRYAQICRTVRTDGVYVEGSGNPARLLAEPNAIGILGFFTLMHAGQGLSVSKLDGIRPTLQIIESGAYPASRELYVYFNRRQANMSVMIRLALEEPPVWQYPNWALVALPFSERRAAFLDAVNQ